MDHITRLHIHAVEINVVWRAHLVDVDVYICVIFGVERLVDSIHHAERQNHEDNDAGYYLLSVYLLLATPQDCLYIVLFVEGPISEVSHCD